uniref:Large ribosomal subunit protein mL44 n=1 Tax=Panagrolaimus superbus TaxID=310955 RepID=A0A914YZ07_9BILA
MIGTFNRIRVLNHASTSFTSSNRGLRKRWQQNYLKDLYHRRIIAGAEPITHRAFLPNWNYGSELFAFRHRLHGEDKENEHFIKALTNPSFFTRKDVADDASYAQPSLEKEIESREDNIQLAKEGDELLYNIVTGYFSLQFPNAPAEFIEAVTNSLINDDVLADAATSLGMQHLVRTGEFPPNTSTLAESFKACLVILSPERRQQTILETIISKAVSLPLEDVLPFRNPLQIVTEYAKKYLKAESVEPRLMHKSGVNSAVPLFYIGIFADQKLIGECAGESLSTAVDLALQASLLRLWGASPETLLINLAFNQQDLSKVSKNHSIFDVVGESIDLSCYSDEELNYDPMDIVNIAKNYDSIEKELGRPRIRHLRHKFSRGSIVRRSFRYLIKPKVYTI